MAAKKKGEDRVPAGSRKSLSEMSDSHKAHVIFWEPHLENLKAEFVWIAVSRFPERGGQGPHYVAAKRGDKDFVIVDYDTANPKPITKRNILEEGITSSTAMLETFKSYRKRARDERAAASATKPKVTKPKGATKPVRKTSASSTKKAPAKPVRKPARTRKPAKSKG